MSIQTRTITIPGGRVAADGETVGVGFPDDLPIPTGVRACGDGLHVFRPRTWRRDAVCACGTVSAGFAILRWEAATTILMRDVDVSHADCEDI